MSNSAQLHEAEEIAKKESANSIRYVVNDMINHSYKVTVINTTALGFSQYQTLSAFLNEERLKQEDW